MNTASTLDTRSLKAIDNAFRSAAEPSLSALLGEHDGTAIGPRWLVAPAPATLWLTGMGGWCGKSFATTPDPLEIAGTNLVRRRGQVHPSIPITARLGASRLDGRQAIIVSYPTDARFPWRRVNDELRPLDEDTLLGLTWGIPGGPASGTPFVLRSS